MIRAGRLLWWAPLVGAITSCGGGTGSSPSTGFATPALNSHKTYTVTDVDPTSTYLNTVIQTITAVNSNGSFSYSEDLPVGTPINGPHFVPAGYDDDGTGHLLRTVYCPPCLLAVISECVASPHGDGPVFPLAAGATWQLKYELSCTAAVPRGSVFPPPATYTQNGSVVDVERVTVPAGTFAAVKLESTITWPMCPAQACTERLTEWRDANTGHLVKSTGYYSYGTAETLTTTTLLSETRELVSQ